MPSWPWRKWKGPNWWLSKDGFQAEEKQIVPKEINWNYSCSDIVWCSADKSEVRFSLCSKESFSNERPQSRILPIVLYFAFPLILKLAPSLVSIRFNTVKPFVPWTLAFPLFEALAAAIVCFHVLFPFLVLGYYHGEIYTYKHQRSVLSLNDFPKSHLKIDYLKIARDI